MSCYPIRQLQQGHIYTNFNNPIATSKRIELDELELELNLMRLGLVSIYVRLDLGGSEPCFLSREHDLQCPDFENSARHVARPLAHRTHKGHPPATGPLKSLSKSKNPARHVARPLAHQTHKGPLVYHMPTHKSMNKLVTLPRV